MIEAIRDFLVGLFPKATQDPAMYVVATDPSDNSVKAMPTSAIVACRSPLTPQDQTGFLAIPLVLNDEPQNFPAVPSHYGALALQVDADGRTRLCLWNGTFWCFVNFDVVDVGTGTES